MRHPHQFRGEPETVRDFAPEREDTLRVGPDPQQPVV